LGPSGDAMGIRRRQLQAPGELSFLINHVGSLEWSSDIEEVKRQNAQGSSGAQSFGTNPQKVREEIAQEAGPFNKPFSSNPAPQSFGGKTASGTDIQKVREEIAQEAGPFGKPFSNPASGSFGAGKTASGTDIQKVREEIAQEAGPFNVSSPGGPQAGKTASGTDIAEVKRQNQQAEQGKNKF